MYLYATVWGVHMCVGTDERVYGDLRLTLGVGLPVHKCIYKKKRFIF